MYLFKAYPSITTVSKLFRDKRIVGIKYYINFVEMKVKICMFIKESNDTF